MRTPYWVVQASSGSLSGCDEGVATREGGTWDGLGGCIGCLLLFGLIVCRRGRVVLHIITTWYHSTHLPDFLVRLHSSTSSHHPHTWWNFIHYYYNSNIRFANILFYFPSIGTETRLLLDAKQFWLTSRCQCLVQQLREAAIFGINHCLR